MPFRPHPAMARRGNRSRLRRQWVAPAKGPGWRGLIRQEEIPSWKEPTRPPHRRSSPAARKPRPATSSPPSRRCNRSSGSTARPRRAERQILARFGGFGAVALSLFPDPVTGRYKDAGWQALGDELKSLLTPEEYDSARRTVFSQYFTSPVVMQAMHLGVRRLGVPENATVLEPGCGTGNFMSHAPAGHRFIGVELDSISGRIARVLHPEADIRIEGFQDSRIPPVDAVIGNPPFGDVDIKYAGEKRPLHDFFFAKSVDVAEARRHPRPGHQPFHAG